MSFTFSGSTLTQANASAQSLTTPYQTSITGGVRFNLTAHGYPNGAFVEIAGTTDYDGAWNISNVAANTFDVVYQHKVSATGVKSLLAYTSGQAGTAALGDKDLSGLTGLSGVTITDLDTSGTDNPYKIYLLANRNVIVTGALQINPDFELLTFDYNQIATTWYLNVTTGILNIGREDYINGAYKPQKQTVLIFTNDDLSATSNLVGDIGVQSGATLNFISGIINSGGAWYFQASSIINITNHAHISGITTTTATRSARLRQYSLALTVDADFTVEGSLRVDFFRIPLNMSGWKPKFTTYGGFAAISSGAGGTNLTFKFYDVQFEGLTFLGDAHTRARVELYNIDAIDKEVLVTHNNGISLTALPATQIFKDFTTNVFDTVSLAVIQGADYYIRDADNGNRYSYDITWNSGAILDSDVDFVYTGTTDALGVTAIDHVVSRIVREGQSNIGVYGNTKPTWVGNATCIIDYRSKNGTYDDLFDVHFFSYNHLQSTSIDIPMGGNGTLEITRGMFVDDYITQTIKATVDAYTEISSGERLYDRQKAWKQDNYEDDYPVITTYPISGDGKALDLNGSITLTIDGAAVSVFAINQTGHVLTIDAGTTFAPSADLTTIKGDITVDDMTIIDNWIIDGNLYLNSANDLTGITVTGDIRVNTGADSAIDWESVDVTGNVWNDDTSHTLTINAPGCDVTAGDPGTGVGETNLTSIADYTLSLTDLEAGVNVTIVNSSTRAELKNELMTGSSTTYVHNGGETVDILLNGLTIDPNSSDIYDLTLPSVDSTIQFQLTDDPNYNNP